MINLEEQKFKWRIVDIQIVEGKMKIIVDFAYGWKEKTMELDDGTTKTYYEGKITRETLESPVSLTTDQLKMYLDTYWGNKYGPLDALEQLLGSIESMKGFTQVY